jgi:hypothetical protein
VKTDLAVTMAAIGTALRSAYPGANVYNDCEKSVTIPCWIVDVPEDDMDIGITFGRTDQYQLPVWYVIGDSWTKDSRDALSAVLSGTPDVASVIEGASTTDFDINVVSAKLAKVTIGDVAYLGLRFLNDIV